MRFRRSASSAQSGSKNVVVVPANDANLQLQLTTPLVAPFGKPELRACDSAKLPNCLRQKIDVQLIGPGVPVVAGADATIIGIVAAVLFLLLRK